MSFLNIEELPNKALQFKDEWFYLAQRIEALSNYKSGFESGFAEALEDIQTRARALAELLESVCVSCQRYAPERRADFESKRVKIQKPLKELVAVVGDDLKAIKTHGELLPRLRELSSSLEASRKRYEEQRDSAQKAREKYGVAKHSYDQKIQGIKSSTDEAIEKLRRSFLTEMSTVLDGYTITPRGGGSEITPELLFEEFARDPEYHNKIEIKTRGISGILSKRGDAKTRLMLFRYKADETYKQIAPILEEEKRKIAQFEDELKILKELQQRCEALKNEEERALSQVKSLELSEQELQRREESLSQKFAHYERVLELREHYLKKLNESGDARNELLSLIESLRGAELPEQDVEKRELRSEIKVLRANVAKLQEEGAHLREQLKAKIAQELELSKLLEEYKSREKALRDDLVRIKDAKVKLENERWQLQRQLEIKITGEAQLIKNLSEAREREKALKESYARLKVEKGNLEAQLKVAAGDLEKTLSKLEAELKNKSKLEEENRRLKVNLDEAVEKAKQALVKYEAEKSEVEKLREEAKAAEELKRRKEKLEEDNRKLKAGLEEAIGRAKEVLSKYEAAKSELEKLRAEAAKIKAAAEAKEGSAVIETEKTEAAQEKEVEAIVGEKIHALRDRKNV